MRRMPLRKLLEKKCQSMSSVILMTKKGYHKKTVSYNFALLPVKTKMENRFDTDNIAETMKIDLKSV